jgi:catechol-2,3-dioxygenase
MGSRWHAVAIDANDPARLGRWWAEVLGLRVLDEDADEVTIGSGGDDRPVLYFTRTDALGGGSGRVHIDIGPDDRDAEVERLVDMGARPVESGQSVTGVLLADPEGNVFRVIAPRASRNGHAEPRS